MWSGGDGDCYGRERRQQQQRLPAQGGVGRGVLGVGTTPLAVGGVTKIRGDWRSRLRIADFRGLADSSERRPKSSTGTTDRISRMTFILDEQYIYCPTFERESDF